ncbi:MAG TPA: ACT domain-containing protein, partial [Armatimonadota bacterium]|nr:ACT domain-containing protein [Armatimonadota bacterium]
DPRICPGTLSLPTVSYEEIAEMAHQGAKVLHPRAAEIAMEHGIPLWVKGTASTEPGTQIAGSAAVLPHRVTAIAHMPRVAYLALRVPYREDRRRLELELFKLMARVRVGFHLLRGSPGVVGFAVAHESLNRVADLLDGLVLPIAREGGGTRLYLLRVGQGGSRSEVQSALLSASGTSEEVVMADAETVETCAIVSVIATRVWETPGMGVAVLARLRDVGVRVLQVADSPLSLSCLVHENDTQRAVHALHAQFIAGAS